MNKRDCWNVYRFSCFAYVAFVGRMKIKVDVSKIIKID